MTDFEYFAFASVVRIGPISRCSHALGASLAPGRQSSRAQRAQRAGVAGPRAALSAPRRLGFRVGLRDSRPRRHSRSRPPPKQPVHVIPGIGFRPEPNRSSRGGASAKPSTSYRRCQFFPSRAARPRHPGMGSDQNRIRRPAGALHRSHPGTRLREPEPISENARKFGVQPSRDHARLAGG